MTDTTNTARHRGDTPDEDPDVPGTSAVAAEEGPDAAAEPVPPSADPASADPASADSDSDSDSDSDDQDGDEDDEDGPAGAAPRGGGTPTDAELFQHSEIAADYIEGLLDILDMDGDIDELVTAGRPVVEVVGGRLQNLVGQRGATLEALQELARLAVFRQAGTPSRLLLDVGGYRATRRKELTAVARNAVEKVKEYGERVRLEPMSAFERKCVHDVVNAIAGVESESEGVEPQRRIVVRPAD